MRYIGIDFGSKRVGVAVSDERGRIAFPKFVIPNNRQLTKEIRELCEEYGASVVVVGESRNVDGTENPILRQAQQWASELAREVSVEIAWEREDFTSESVREVQGDIKTDASAAALILQHYLDAHSTKGK